jgi:hypothetical protein
MIWFLLPLSPHPHVILHAGLARSCRIHCFKKRKITCSLGIRCPQGRMRIVRKCFCLALTHLLRRSPPLQEGDGYLLDDGFCDFAIPLRAEWQVGKYAGKSKSSWTIESIWKKNLALCALVFGWCCVNMFFDWCNVDWFWIDSCLW